MKVCGPLSCGIHGPALGVRVMKQPEPAVGNLIDSPLPLELFTFTTGGVHVNRFQQKHRRRIEAENRSSIPVVSGDGTVRVIKSDVRGSGKRERMAVVAGIGRFYNPATTIAQALSDALDPAKAPGKVRTMAEMSPDEIEAIKQRYSCG